MARIPYAAGEPIRKPAMLVTSSGRTGTNFLAWLLGRVVRDCDAFHEPDVFDSVRVGETLKRMARFGVWQLTLGKLTRGGNLRRLGLEHLCGRLDVEAAARRIVRLRGRFVAALPGRVYAEANVQLNGLVEALPLAFPNCKIAWLVRDPRDWVASCLAHRGGRYGRRDLASRLGGRLTARNFPGDSWGDSWARMGLFEKSCWLWWKENSLGLQAVERTPAARWFKFEEIFRPPHGYQHLGRLLDFLTSFPDGSRAEYGSLEGVLEHRLNASAPEKFPSWRNWSPEQVSGFYLFCGRLMERLGYGGEPEWRELCRQAGVGGY